MFARDDVVRGALIRGVDPRLEPGVSDIAARIAGGRITDLVEGEFGIIPGVELARALGVTVGDRVTLIAPQGTVTPAGIAPRLKQFRVVGIFESGHFEFDSALALIHVGDAQKLFQVTGPTGVRLKLDDMHARAGDRHATGRRPSGATSSCATGRARTAAGSRAVQIEKRMMFIILTLIIAVAAFNLVSTLVMTVTEKQADIAILRTLGRVARAAS